MVEVEGEVGPTVVVKKRPQEGEDVVYGWRVEGRTLRVVVGDEVPHQGMEENLLARREFQSEMVGEEGLELSVLPQRLLIFQFLTFWSQVEIDQGYLPYRGVNVRER